MAIIAYESLPRREANTLLRNQKLFKPGQAEIAQEHPHLLWVAEPLPREPARLLTPQWRALRRAVFQRDNYTCTYCGARGVKLHCDHKIPISRGGTDDMSNLTTACARCNQSKSTRTHEEWP